MKKFKQIGATTAILLGLAVPTMTTFADTATVSPSQNISVDQQLKQQSDSTGSAAANNAVSDSTNAANTAASKAIEAKHAAEKNTANTAGSAAANITDQVVNGANGTAGSPKDYTGQDLAGIANRFGKLSDTVGSGAIAVLIKIFYYGSFIGIITSGIGVLLSLFFKKMKTMKWLLAGVGSSVIFAFISHLSGLTLADNPIVGILTYLFTGHA